MVLSRCRALRPALHFAVISGSDSAADMQRAIDAGARGYVSKSVPGEAMVTALREVLAGKSHYGPSVPVQADEPAGGKLTLRQLEVLALLCQGQSNKQIARGLDLAEQTIKVHITAIFKSLNVVNRTQAALAARRLGLSTD